VLGDYTVDVELLLLDLRGDVFAKKRESSTRLGIGGERVVPVHTFSRALSWQREFRIHCRGGYSFGGN